jgi:hypothetical protein
MEEWNETPKATVSKLFDLPISNKDEWETIKKMLEEEIAFLIKNNFEKLLHILYRIDINENDAMTALQKTDAASRLTDLIIQRQIEKVKSRQQHR